MVWPHTVVAAVIRSPVRTAPVIPSSLLCFASAINWCNLSLHDIQWKHLLFRSLSFLFKYKAAFLCYVMLCYDMLVFISFLITLFWPPLASAGKLASPRLGELLAPTCFGGGGRRAGKCPTTQVVYFGAPMAHMDIQHSICHSAECVKNLSFANRWLSFIETTIMMSCWVIFHGIFHFRFFQKKCTSLLSQQLTKMPVISCPSDLTWTPQFSPQRNSIIIFYANEINVFWYAGELKTKNFANPLILKLRIFYLANLTCVFLVVSPSASDDFSFPFKVHQHKHPFQFPSVRVPSTSGGCVGSPNNCHETLSTELGDIGLSSSSSSKKDWTAFSPLAFNSKLNKPTATCGVFKLLFPTEMSIQSSPPMRAKWKSSIHHAFFVFFLVPGKKQKFRPIHFRWTDFNFFKP